MIASRSIVSVLLRGLGDFLYTLKAGLRAGPTDLVHGGSMATLMYIDAASISLAIQFLVILAIVILVGRFLVRRLRRRG